MKKLLCHTHVTTVNSSVSNRHYLLKRSALHKKTHKVEILMDLVETFGNFNFYLLLVRPHTYGFTIIPKFCQ